MATTDEIYRVFVMRQNRMLGTYLALMAWEDDLACVAINRDQLVRFWGSLKRVEDERLAWFQSDLKPLFPHFRAMYENGQKFACVFLARRPFPAEAFSSPDHTQERIGTLNRLSVKTSLLDVPTEAELLSRLSAVVHGLSSSLLGGLLDEVTAQLESLAEQYKSQEE